MHSQNKPSSLEDMVQTVTPSPLRRSSSTGSGLALAQLQTTIDWEEIIKYDNLVDLFICPACKNTILTPIHQCRKGHIICGACKPKVKCCPTCKQTFSEFTNIMMEKVRQSVAFPCKYKGQGCMEKKFHNVKQMHENYCLYKPVPCPYSTTGCQETHPVKDVQVHLKTCKYAQKGKGKR